MTKVIWLLKFITEALGFYLVEHLIMIFVGEIFNDTPGKDLKEGLRIRMWNQMWFERKFIRFFDNNDVTPFKRRVVDEMRDRGIKFYKTYVTKETLWKLEYIRVVYIYTSDTSEFGETAFNSFLTSHSGFITIVRSEFPNAVALSDGQFNMVIDAVEDTRKSNNSSQDNEINLEDSDD